MQKPKIAFLLRESNDDFYEIRGRSDLLPSKGSSKTFWRNLNIWSYIVTSYLNGATPTLEEALARKEALVDSIAYINVKKLAENKNVSCDTDIQKYADQDWVFLQRQINLVNPDVIFCCGTYRYIKPHIETDHLGKGIYQYQDKMLIDFYHPSSRGRSYKSFFNQLSFMLGPLPQKTSG